MAKNQHRKAHAFIKHLAKAFQPHPSENEPKKEEALIQLLKTSHQLKPPSTVSKELKFKTSTA
jgi:hypothetical protein